MRFSCLFACVAIAPLPIAAAEPVRLQPSSQWIVDYADNSCRLVRTFGEGEAKTILLFENLAERATRKLQRQQFAEKATQLEIQTRRNRPVILETGSMGGPIRSFDKCSRNSLKDWGVDPDLEDKIVRPVWAPGGIAKWFSTDDYPRKMLMQGRESDVKIRLLVDASGKVSKCTSLSHYDSPEFNQITCNLIVKRAKIEPAELADGTKVPSYATLRIRWEMGR